MPDVERVVVDPEAVGRLPSEVYAIIQSGKFNDGKLHHHVELVSRKARLDEGVLTVRKYGDPSIKYKAVYGTITWLEEEEIIPDSADMQLSMLPSEPVKRKKGKSK